MLSKNQIKIINQLNQKKYRKKYRLFIAEGIKTVKEFLNSEYELEKLYLTTDVLYVPDNKYKLVTTEELEKISRLTSPQVVLALFKIPEIFSDDNIKLQLALDGVRDPGNLGTIIRLCDWFGIRQLVCSPDTVDCYNPKTVQASMGSLARVKVVYSDLYPFLKESDLPIYGTFMDGESIYEQQLAEKGIIVMGNEGQGISKEIGDLTDYKIGIPQFGQQKSTESLNVAMASAIVLNEFKRP